MMKKLVYLTVLVGMVLALAACGTGSSKPQPSCKSGYTAVVDSVSENNPYGVCQDAKGNVVNGEKSFADFFAAAKKTVEAAAKCYNDKGMATTCVYEQTIK